MCSSQVVHVQVCMIKSYWVRHVLPHAHMLYLHFSCALCCHLACATIQVQNPHCAHWQWLIMIATMCQKYWISLIKARETHCNLIEASDHHIYWYKAKGASLPMSAAAQIWVPLDDEGCTVGQHVGLGVHVWPIGAHINVWICQAYVSKVMSPHLISGPSEQINQATEVSTGIIKLSGLLAICDQIYIFPGNTTSHTNSDIQSKKCTNSRPTFAFQIARHMRASCCMTPSVRNQMCMRSHDSCV